MKCGAGSGRTDRALVSIITVVLNRAATVERAILSVLEQSYPQIEHIIIDGGSTDGTTEVIERYAERLAYWTSEPDKGSATPSTRASSRRAATTSPC